MVFMNIIRREHQSFFEDSIYDSVPTRLIYIHRHFISVNLYGFRIDAYRRTTFLQELFLNQDILIPQISKLFIKSRAGRNMMIGHIHSTLNWDKDTKSQS